MQYQDTEGNIITVRKNKCYNGYPVEFMSTEELAAIGLTVYEAPVVEPDPPTASELAQQELAALDQVLSRAEEDLFDALVAKGVLTGDEPELSFVKTNKDKKVAERAKL